MRYPRRNNRLVWKQLSEDTYRIRDCVTGGSFTAGNLVIKLLKKLDGKRDPYSAVPELEAEEVRELLEKMSEAGLIRSSRVLIKWEGEFYYALLFARHTCARSRIPALLDTLRMALWLPVLVIGIWQLLNCSLYHMGGPVWLGILLGIVTGMILHECSHAVSCLHWGGRWFEAGVMLTYYVLPGMYVLLDEKPVRSRLHRILISGAGIEMNFLLTGLFFLLAAENSAWGNSFFYAACSNLTLAAINLLPISGIDGMGMLGHLLGSENAAEQAKLVLRSREHRRKLRQKGIAGWTELLACWLLILMQSALPALILLGIVEVVLQCRQFFA